MSEEQFALAEVKRAAEETRSALSQMGQRGDLAYPLMGICALIDRTKLAVTGTVGESAFVLDEENNTVSFRAATITLVAERAVEFAEEVGYTNELERLRFVQLAVNLFVIHELIHIHQNFPHFGSVEVIKRGFPGGVAMLDVAADTLAAWTCANVECERLGTTSADEIRVAYANALTLAYLVGAFVFDARSQSLKRQRALGLVVSAVLVQALTNGTLVREAVFSGWRELSPVIVLELEDTEVFNAMVIDGGLGMLLAKYQAPSGNLASRLWESVGRRPVADTLSIAARILMEMGAIRST